MELINDIISNHLLIIVLLLAAIYFTVTTRGVQFGMFSEMWRLLLLSGRRYDSHRRPRRYILDVGDSPVGSGDRLCGVYSRAAI